MFSSEFSSLRKIKLLFRGDKTTHLQAIAGRVRRVSTEFSPFGSSKTLDILSSIRNLAI